MNPSSILLVVEDDLDILVLIRASLRADPRLGIAGHAASADQAIALCATIQPKLIILDHMLEGPKTGMEVAPELKKAAPQTTILLFSAYNLEAEVAADPSIEAYLKKTDISKLLPTIQRLLGLGAL